MNMDQFFIPHDYRIRNAISIIRAESNFRLFKRKNGELVLQQQFTETTQYLDDNSQIMKPIWKDVETVNEE